MSRSFPLLLILVIAACNLPRDAGGTLERVRNGTLRAGYMVHPPWVIDASGAPAGVEARLVQELARSLGASIAWVRGPEDELLTALEHRELDIVIGGLTRESPWKKQVGLTRPYYIDSTIVSGLRDATVRGMKGESVGVEDGDPAAVYIRKKGGRPVPLSNLGKFSGPVAAPAWKLNRLGRPAAGVLLHTSRQVLAVAPGENGWLLRVEELLHRHERDFPTLLRESPQ
jgi:polar amino acid transport system substrate-binding protein